MLLVCCLLALVQELLVYQVPPACFCRPLQTETAEISLQQASVLAKDVDLLAINAEMKDLAEQHTANARTGRQRLMMLHQSLRAGGGD